MVALASPVNAGFKEHFDLGQQYLANYQYSGAISEFRSALRINYLDNSARIGLVNSYLARGAHLANTDKNYAKAANDYRSALFYLVYYPNTSAVRNSSQAIVNVNSNLNKCLTALNFNTSAKNRFETAKQLRAEGEFAAAGYEFNQSLGDTAYIKDSFEQVGDIMRLVGNDQKSAEYYKKALSVSPADVNIRMSYAKALDKLGQESEAVQEYNYVLARIGDDKEMLYTLERIYKKKLETSPSDAVITSNLGAIMQKQGKLDEALRYYSKAEYLDPSNVTTRINTGTLYQQKGDYRTAITAYDSVLVLHPDSAQANLYKAQSLAALGDKKSAIEHYKKVIALEPNNIEAQAQIVELLCATMPANQFMDYIRKNLPDVKPVEIMYNYALDLHKQNKLEEAIAAYNEVLKLETGNPEIYLNLGIAQAQNKNYQAAYITLNTALIKFPNNVQLRDELFKLTNALADEKLRAAADLFEKGKFKEAAEAYIQIRPATAESMLGAAAAHQKLNDNNAALEYYKKAFAMRQTDSEIAYTIAALYAAQNKFDDARNYNTKALALNKTNKNALELVDIINQNENAVIITKAIALFDSGKFDESLAGFNKILEKDPKNASALYYRAMIFDEGINGKKEYAKAIADYKAALALDPSLVIINYLIGVAYDNLEQPKNALPYFKKFVETYTQEDDFKNYATERIKQ